MSVFSNNDHIYEVAYELLTEKGVKATTMDSLSKKLQMSKRTLYEIFDNKNDLVVQTLEYHRRQHRKKCDEAFRSSANLIEGLLSIFKLHREEMKRVNIDFFRDLDRLYPSLKPDLEENRTEVINQLQQLFAQGMEEGLFLDNLNYKALTHILILQMDAIKRVEKDFPDDLSFADIIDTMSICFLRSVVSPKGMKLLNEKMPQFYPELKN